MQTIYKITLNDRPDLYPKLIKLIEDSFEYRNNSFEIDFAPLVSKKNHQHLHLLIDKKTDQIICHVGLRLKTFTNQNFTTTIAFLGGIATNKDYRNQGHFKTLINQVTNEYNPLASLFMLWSDNAKLYEKFNFYEAGTVVQTGQENFTEIENHFEQTSLSKLNPTQLEQIKQLYNTKSAPHILTPFRDDDDWEILSRITSTQLFIKKNKRNTITHYFFINKGQDLTGIIHEIAPLDEKYFSTTFFNQKVWLPQKIYHGSQVATFYMASLRAGSLAKFHELISFLTHGDASVQALKNEKIYFKFKAADHALEARDFYQAFFGPNKLKEFNSYPFDLYVPGLESI